jgi:2-phosphoglycolate phosphatase
MAIKLIIFDLDGTLINSIEDITNALNYAFGPSGVNDLSTTEVTAMVGEGPLKLIQDVLTERHLVADKEMLVTRFLDYYASHPTDKTVLYPGTREMLETLKDLKIAIVTNKTEALSLNILKKYELDKYFDMVVAVDTIAERKPSPVPVTHVLSAFNVPAEDAIIVGDSTIDIETGKASLVRTVAVIHGYGRTGFQDDADFVIGSLPELINIVKNENGQNDTGGPVSMHIERYGEGEKILFIHGSGWNTHMWYSQSDYLKSSMEVMLVDLPGHGESSSDGCDSVEKYRDAVYEMIREHAFGKCYIAGHSLGGAIAISLALSYPDILKGIILIGTGARLRVLPQILEGIINDKENTVRNIGELAFSKKKPSALKSQAIYETMKCKAEIIHKDFFACNQFNVMDTVNSIATPALIICGTDDALTLPKYSLYLHEAIKDSRLTLIEDAGHMVMMEKPMEVNKAIEEFVKDEDNRMR